jgi:hypothetical protein
MANVVIELAAEFTGKKAFKQAETSTDKLTRSVKTLAGAFGVTFGAAAMARYAQNAVKAFADSQLEAVQLTNAVKNLGLAFASRDIDIYIDKVERATGVNRDQLQPAMIKLLQVTGSVTKSQELLNLAMDVAAGTGQDLTSTSEKLSQAYVGNFKGLRSLNLGLTQAELASSNFEEVQQRLQVLFAGQATTAANSYVGSLNKLSIASEQASEKIGKSLLDALTAISGGTTVDDTIKKIDTLSSAIAGLIDVTVGLKAGEYLQQYYALKDGKIAGGFGNRSMSVLGQDTQKSDLSARKKAEADAAKRAKQLLAMQSAATKAQKDALKLAKARAIFDLQKIQIEAALKGKISEEDKIRLKLMQAIEEENLTNVEKYQKALEKAQEKTKELTELLATVKTLELKDPFGLWKVDPLTASINALTASMFAVQTQIQANGREWSSFSSTVAGTSIKPNLGEWNSSFSAAGKSAADAIAAQSKAQQDAVAAQIKSAQDAAAAQLALLTAGSAEQKAALEAQLKAQSEALAAQAKAQMEALQTRLADEAAAYKEAAEAAAAAAQAALLTGATDYTAASLAKIASDAAAQAAAAQAAQAAADQASAATSTAGSTPIAITVNTGIGDPNAIAEEIQKLLQDAANRGVLIGGLYAE